MNQTNDNENIIETSTEFKKIGVRHNKYGNRNPKKVKMKSTILSLIIWGLIIAILSGVVVYFWQISPLNRENKENIYFVIEEGESSEHIAKTLVQKGLIRNESFFKLYTKIKDINHFVEGKYKASQKDSFKEIMNMIVNGEVDDTLLIFQILEGKNIRYIANKVQEEFGINKIDFMNKVNDKVYIDTLIEKYWFLNKDIKNKNIYYYLEGYLFPDTYHFDKEDTDIELIIETMLNRTEEILEPYKSKYVDDEGKDLMTIKTMPIHQILTLASCAELEGAGEENRREIVGVFINRLQSGMNMGSDPSTYYAIKVDISERDLTMSEIMKENPYNTRGPNMIGKVPIGPICAPSKESIDATFNYKVTKNLFFASDKNGKMYFSATEAEHDEKIEELIDSGLWYIHEE